MIFVAGQFLSVCVVCSEFAQFDIEIPLRPVSGAFNLSKKCKESGPYA
jgi:hypothetical protein